MMRMVSRLVWFRLVRVLFVWPLYCGSAWSSPLYYPKALHDDILAGQISNTELKLQLHSVLKNYHRPGREGQHDQITESCNLSDCFRHDPLTYKQARRVLFGRIHLKKTRGNFSVEDVYCSRWLAERHFSHRPPGPDTIPDPRVVNAEHTWPQSRFSRRYGTHFQKSDLHALYPVDSRANSSRGNVPFGDVENTFSQMCKASRKGASTESARTVFEPPSRHKGNVARALFYFSIRYEMPIDSEQEAYLRIWDQLDPPDARELERNDIAFEAQHNRNPFVDFENLAQLIADF